MKTLNKLHPRNRLNLFRKALVLFLILPFTVHADLIDDGFTAEYEVYLSGIYIGAAERRLQREGQRLTYTSIATPGGLAGVFVSDVITETSVMEHIDGRIRPLNYAYKQEGGKKNKNGTVRFEWAVNEIQFSHDKQRFPLSKHAYDVLNFQLAMMLELQNNKRKFMFEVADYRGLYTYRAEVIGKETITIPAGEFDVIKVDSYNVEKGKRFVFWCAPKLGYLPVRVEYTKKKDSDVSELKLKSVKVAPKP